MLDWIQKTIGNGRELLRDRHALILPAAFGAVALSLLATPMDSLAAQGGMNAANIPIFYSETVNTFTRQAGNALLSGIDIDQRISNMTFYGFFLLPLLFLLCWGLLCLLFRGKEISTDGLSFLNRLTAAAFPALFVTLFNRLDSSIFSYFSPIAYFAVLSVLLYLRFGAERLPLPQFKWAFFSALSLEFFGIRLLYGLLPALPALSASFLRSTVAALGVYLCILLVLCLLGARFARSPHCDCLCAASTPLYAAPILVSVFLELTNILNQHSIFIGHKTMFSLLIALTCALMGAAWFLTRGRKLSSDPADWTRWQYPLLVFGFTVLMLQPAMQIGAGTELFESSNAGSDVYAFLTAGELPLIENLNVHMILDEIGQILYGVFNGDALGAVWFSYPVTALAPYLLFYWLFSELTDRETGVLLALFFPVSAFFWCIPYIFGFLPILTALYACRKRTVRAQALFVLSCVVLCLHRADIGLTCGVAAVLVLTVIFLKETAKKPLAALWASGVCAGILFAGIFVLLCLYRGISPLARILELISILQSNINWAYTMVAPAYGLQFFLCYLLLPVAVTVCCALVLLLRKQKNFSRERCALAVILGLSYLMNYSRGIIRHNLMESAYAFILGNGVLCILVCLWLLTGRRTLALPLVFSLVFVLQPIFGMDNVQGNSLMQDSLNQQLQTGAYQTYPEKVDRVVIPEELKAVYEPLKTIFDATLTSEQTYFDNSCDTILYALTDRNKPVFTNQSPSQLNREFDHLMFLRELEEMDTPYALCKAGGAGFDGIELDTNHYLTSEYLNQNYRPLCLVGSYCLWVDRAQYGEKRAAIENLAAAGAVTVTFVEDATEPSLVKNHTLGQLPWLWGTYDKAPQQEVFDTLCESPTTQAEGMQLLPTETPGSFTFSLRDGDLGGKGSNPRVAIWCSAVEDQDDLIWYPLTADGSLFTTAFSVADHMGQTGEYQFHVYYDGADGTQQFEQGFSAEIPLDDDAVTTFQRVYALSLATLDRSSGNYLEITVENSSAAICTAELLGADGKTLCTMSFDLQNGAGRYLLRVSSNYFWYTDAITNLRLSAQGEMDGVAVRVLRGDVDYGSMNALQRKVLAQDLRLNAQS